MLIKINYPLIGIMVRIDRKETNYLFTVDEYQQIDEKLNLLKRCNNNPEEVVLSKKNHSYTSVKGKLIRNWAELTSFFRHEYNSLPYCEVELSRSNELFDMKSNTLKEVQSFHKERMTALYDTIYQKKTQYFYDDSGNEYYYSIEDESVHFTRNEG